MSDPPLEGASSGEGYDADEGPLETGFASESISLAGEGEAEMMAEAGLSIDPEDLGKRLLRDAAQLDPIDSARVGESIAQSGVSHELYDEDSDEDAISPSEPSQLDLTQDNILEGSLFDQPRNEGGVRRPAIRVNEVDATLERNERAAQARKRRAR